MAAYINSTKKNSGQALPEYVVGTLLVYLALFAPIEYAPFNGKSVISALVSAFQQNYKSYEFAVSQPTLD
jgi:hypothetical protein